MSKTVDEAHCLLEEMTSNNYQWPNERSILKKAAGVHEVNQLIALSAQVSALSNQIATWNIQGTPPTIESAAVEDATFPGVETSHEQVQYVNNQNYNHRGNPLPNYYYLRLRNHENLSYGNKRNVMQSPHPGFNNQTDEKKLSLEDLLGTFITKTSNIQYG